MRVRALHLARLILILALFPALAGCLKADERLDRSDLRETDGEAPRAERVIPWASPEDALIKPGDVIRTEAGDCPTSFFLARPDTGSVFLATTGYCVRDLPVGTIGTIGPDDAIVVLIYNSFHTMQEIGESDQNALEYNDLAVYYVDPRYHSMLNPSIPGGGPIGLAENDDITLGDRLRMFVHETLLPAGLDWREGVVAGHAGDWAFLAYTPLPGAPGTLGGPVVDTDGRAVGVIATLGVFPNPGAHGVARLDTMLQYAAAHAGLDLELAAWDAPTAPPESS